jgi:peroxiredoxin Q/BCP
MKLTEGKQAPDFSLPDEKGKVHKLSDYKGKAVVLYFYPADDTPGCTAEACDLRDDYHKYQKADTVILGVSPDDEASHEAFKKKYKLPFTLLADKGHIVCDLYGVWGEKSTFGKKYFGVNRSTFVIDTQGKIKNIFEKVRAKDNNQKVLAALHDQGIA